MGGTYTNVSLDEAWSIVVSWMDFNPWPVWADDGIQSEHAVDSSIVVVIILKQKDLMLHVLI